MEGIDLRHVLSAQLAIDVVVCETRDEPDRNDEEQHVR